MQLRFEELGPSKYRVHYSNIICAERVIGTVQLEGARWAAYTNEGKLIGTGESPESIAKSLACH